MFALIKTILKYTFQLRRIANSLDRLVKLYESDLNHRGVDLPIPPNSPPLTAEDRETELSYTNQPGGYVSQDPEAELAEWRDQHRY